jgi:UPF0755 protein
MESSPDSEQMQQEESILETEAPPVGFLAWIRRRKGYLMLAAGILLFACAIALSRAPSDFPLGNTMRVEAGQSLQSVTLSLYRNHIISSPLLFRSAVILFGGEKRVIAGNYLLDTRDGIIALAWRLVQGRFHIGMAKLTIPEGWSAVQIADYLQDTLPHFDRAGFLSAAKKQEGYLFPDTYFVSPSASASDIIGMMRQNFDAKIASLPEIKSSSHSLSEIVTMASILEEETKTPEARREVSGILWHRITLGIPLQVDSAFAYVNGKNTYSLTADDLKIDSPYNTYVHAGLPPGPISNPGLDAIAAALHPTQSDYLYFLSSKDGTMHYAKTFEEHKSNKLKYL